MKYAYFGYIHDMDHNYYTKFINSHDCTKQFSISNSDVFLLLLSHHTGLMTVGVMGADVL